MHLAPSYRLVIRNFFSTLLLTFLSWAAVLAQPVFSWDVVLGGESYEELNALDVLPDGIIAGGSTRSGIAFGDPGDFSWNILVVKLDFDGNVLWQYTYGGAQDERLWALIPTRDGGFLAGGYSYSGVGGDKTEPSRGDKDVWIIKLDASGQLQWDKTFGGLLQDELFSVLEMPDGGYLLGCHSNSGLSGDKTEDSRGSHDIWMIRTDGQGNKTWDKTLGGSGYEQINDLVLAADGAVYCSGGSTSPENDGDLGPETARGGMDFLLLKIDPVDASVYWSRRYGGAGEDYAYSLIVASSGRLYLGGRSGSPQTPAGPYNNGKSAPFYGGASDFWLLELDTDGQKTAEWSFGGDGLDDLYDIVEKPCGGLVVGGVSDSGASGNKTSDGRGSFDYWVVSLDSDGAKLWDQSIGGAGGDALTHIAQFTDGSLLFGGHSDSPAGFEKTTTPFGFNDFWMVSSRCSAMAEISAEGPGNPCSDEPLILSANVPDCPTCTYEWNTGASDPAIEVPPGTVDTFSVKVCNEGACVAYDTIVVATFPPLQIELGADIELVSGATLTLQNNLPEWSYLWNTGSTAAAIPVTQAGTYSVTVTDQNGCTDTDIIQVTRTIEKKQVWVPNIFSPNDDGYSDYLSIFTDDSGLQVITFQIADRWGDLCYRRDNFVPVYANEGWNGRWQGKLAAAGVYGWFAIVEFSDGERLLLEGNVTLVR